MASKISKMLRPKTTRGVAGFFDDDHQCMEAAKRLRDSGYRQFDAITPFPVHGMEEAIGIRRSPIPYVTFVFGIIGFCAGMGFQYYTSAVDWRLIIGGMPFFPVPAYIPVAFETTILFAALASVAAMFALNGLPKVDPPILDPDLTSHRFALWVPETEKNFDAQKVESFLKELGATDIRQTEF